MKVGEIKKIRIRGEICCERCNEVVHNHIDCPVCERKNVGTDCYFDLYEKLREDGELIIQCPKCKAVFKFVDEDQGELYWGGLWQRI